MRVGHWALGVLAFLGLVLPGGTSPGQGNDKAKAGLRELRQRLAGLKAGMRADQVLKVLGKPDEVRRVPEGHLLDGVRLLGDLPGVGPEAERWAYGVTRKGTFARVGFVSVDRNGNVVAAVPADCFAGPGWKLPERVPAARDRAVPTPGKLSCHVGAVRFHPKAGETAEGFETTVTLKNAGAGRFELRHDAAYSLRRFLLVEVYDSAGVLLFRDDEMRYHSPNSPDPARWPVLAVGPGKEVAAPLSFSPSHGFGPLPAGRYSLRVYFPFEGRRYYPSNAAAFEVKEGARTRGQEERR
jgi:hypothetical protein